jgi:predicted Zn-dependent protease
MTMGFEAASLLGDVLMKENRVPEAIEAYQHALAMRPDSQYIEVRLRQAKGEKV